MNPRKLALAGAVGAAYGYWDEENDAIWKPAVSVMASTAVADMVGARMGRNGLLAKGVIGGAAHCAIEKFAFGEEPELMKCFLTGAALVFTTEAVASGLGANMRGISAVGSGSTAILYS